MKSIGHLPPQRPLLLFLLAASLMLAGCDPLLQQSPPQTAAFPVLEAGLAAPCQALVVPNLISYDDLQSWIQTVVLPAYVECANLHQGVVNSWPGAKTPSN